MRAKTGELAVNEWNFQPLLHRYPLPAQWWELRAATAYEYGRESASLRKLAKKYAGLPRELMNGDIALLSGSPEEKRISEFMILPFWQLILWPDFFPDCAWLDIPSEQRQVRVEAFRIAYEENVIEVKGLHELKPWENAFSPDSGDRYFSSRNEHVLVSMNWAFSNTDLISAIGNWVRNNRPGNFPEPRTSASRDNVDHARLTRLGRMRLLNAYSHTKAAVEAGRNEVYFPSASNALKARDQVTTDMHAIFQTALFIRQKCKPPIPENERPIHWNTFAGAKNGK